MPRIQSLEQLKSSLGESAADFSDQELLEALAQYKKVPISKAAEMYGYDKAKGPWAERGGAAIDAYQSSMYGLVEDVAGNVGSSVVSEWAKKGRQRNELQSGISRERAKLGGIPDDWRDVDGPLSLGRWVGGLALDSGPYLAEAAVGGVVGRLASGGLRLAAGASAAERAAVARGGMMGAVGASYPSAVGDILNNQREEGGTTGAAYALGVPYAAMNLFGLEGMAARAGMPRVISPVLDNVTGVRGRMARAGVTGVQTAVSEGSSETAQEMINQLGRMSANELQTFWNEEAKKRYVDSFVGGAALGGVIGGAASGGRRSADYSSPMAVPTVSDDPAPPTGGGLNILQLGYDRPTFITFPDGTTAIGDDAAFGRRFAPQPADRPVGPDGQRAIGYDGQPLLLGYDPSAGRPPLYGVQGGGVALSEEEAFQERLRPRPADPEVIATTPPAIGEPQEPIPIAENVQNPPPGADTPAQDAPPVAGSGSPEALARIEETKVRKVAAEDAIVRAKEAGMESEKQQTAFWRMEELAKEGKLPESKATQITALLMQQKFGKVKGMLDEAAAGVPDDDGKAIVKNVARSLEQVDKELAKVFGERESLRDKAGRKPRAGDKLIQYNELDKSVQALRAEKEKVVAQAAKQAGLKEAPAVIEAPTPAAPPPGAQPVAQPTQEPAPAVESPPANQKVKKLKATAEKANKIRRYESLLACLGR